MNLFGSFPKALQQQKVENWVQPGAIVYLHCSWLVEKNYQEKYLIIGCTQPQCLLLMVNSVERFSAPRPTQVLLTVATYGTGVFTHDCYVNCNTVVTQLTDDEVAQQILDDPGRYRRNLNNNDRVNVVAAIKYATDISPEHQDMLLEALAA